MRETRLRVGAAILGLVAGVVALVLATADGGSVRPWLVLACFVTAGVVAGEVAVVWVAWREDLATSVRVEAEAGPARTDRQRGGQAGVERRLQRGLRDADSFSHSVAPWLRELAEHRLRRHGIDPAADPARAQAAMGEDLWQLTNRPITAPVSRTRLDRAVAALERL